MDNQEFRQQLIISSLQGFASNPFLAQQLASAEAIGMRVDSVSIIAKLAVNTADEVFKKLTEQAEQK